VHYLKPYHNIKQDIKLQMSMVVKLGIRDFTRSAKEEDFPSMYSIMIIMLLCLFVGRHEFLFFFLFFWVPSLLKDGVCFAYRYWPNNRSRMYLIENTGVFVRSHQLEEGDLLILYRNVERNKIVLYLDVLNTITVHNIMFVGLFSE
jgi:hypothetical protein